MSSLQNYSQEKKAQFSKDFTTEFTPLKISSKKTGIFQNNLFKKIFKKSQKIEGQKNSENVQKVLSKILILKSRQKFGIKNEKLVKNSNQKLKDLQQRTMGAKILENVSSKTPKNIQNPRIGLISSKNLIVKKRKRDFIKKEILRPNKRILNATFSLVLVGFLALFLPVLTNKFESINYPKTFASEEKTAVNEIEKVKEIVISDVQNLVLKHQKILQKTGTNTATGANNLILPTPDTNKKAVLQIKEAGVKLDLKFKTEDKNSPVYFYDFAGKIGTNQKSYILISDQMSVKKLVNMVPSAKLSISGLDAKGMDYVWNYSLISKNSYNLQDETIFNNNTKANLGLILNKETGDLEFLEAKLIGVEKL